MSQTQPHHVVLLDDEALILRALARTFRALGFEVTATSDPEEALAVVREKHPDAVVSDLHMPMACGASFLAEVADAAPATLRVLLSADPDFRPKVGNLADARLHALLGKPEMRRLAPMVVEMLEARVSTATAPPELVALATRLGDRCARPAHEDSGHRTRTSRWTEVLAARLGLGDDQAFDAGLGALLHDIGQCTVPSYIFNRPGALGPLDQQDLERHPCAGGRLLQEVPVLLRAMPVVLDHHERWDGSGYPRRIGGADIDRGARVFQVVDGYDAMRTGRHYRRAKDHVEALQALAEQGGKQLDPEVVTSFCALSEADLRGMLDDSVTRFRDDG